MVVEPVAQRSGRPQEVDDPGLGGAACRARPPPATASWPPGPCCGAARPGGGPWVAPAARSSGDRCRARRPWPYARLAISASRAGPVPSSATARRYRSSWSGARWYMPGPGHEAVGGQLHVARRRRSAAIAVLYGRLVGTEADVPVGPEDPALAELVRQVGQQGRHRGVHGLLVDRPCARSSRLRVVGLESFVELQGLRRPPLECHGRECSQPPALIAADGSGDAG